MEEEFYNPRYNMAPQLYSLLYETFTNYKGCIIAKGHDNKYTTIGSKPMSSIEEAKEYIDNALINFKINKI